MKEKLSKINELLTGLLSPMDEEFTSWRGEKVYRYYGQHTSDVLIAAKELLLEQRFECVCLEYGYYRGCIMSRDLGFQLTYCEGDFNLTLFDSSEYEKEVSEYEEFLKDN